MFSHNKHSPILPHTDKQASLQAHGALPSHHLQGRPTLQDQPLPQAPPCDELPCYPMLTNPSINTHPLLVQHSNQIHFHSHHLIDECPEANFSAVCDCSLGVIDFYVAVDELDLRLDLVAIESMTMSSYFEVAVNRWWFNSCGWDIFRFLI